MLLGLRALGALSRGSGTFVMPTDFILPRGEGGPAIQAWASALDGLTVLQATQAPHLLWAFQDSAPAWTVLMIHRGHRSFIIVDSLRRPHSRLAEAITTWITELWNLAPETPWQAYALPAGPTPPVAHSAAHAIFNVAQLLQDILDAGRLVPTAHR